MTHQTSSDGAAAVDHDYFWLPIDTCPKGVKVQYLSIGGIALHGIYRGKEDKWQGWTPLPKKPKKD